MRVISKRAADLKPGDILEAVGACPRRVFCYASRHAAPGIVQPITAPLEPQPPAVPGYYPGACPVPAPEAWRPDEMVRVEVADECLSEQEIDLLAEVARMQLHIGLDPVRQAAVEQLLARVRPEPPSLEELLKLAERAAVVIARGEMAPGLRDDLEAMLERARRTGVLARG
jgi:hypothetical protein